MRSELQKVEGISAQGIYSSATEAAFVGGDFYDLIRLPERRACVIMGDVSGKGVEAASVSAAVRTALAAYSWEGLSPARMVELLNDFLLGFARVETFATLFVGIVDLAAGELTYCSAGHPPAVILRAATGELEWLGEQSGVVGAFHDMAYHDGHVTLYEGDLLVLYTDGTTEARAADGRFFGEDGLRDAVMREGVRGFEGLTDRLLASVEAFTGNSLDDDVAMVALRFDQVG
jgi:serine phosphatase RsbU (regulator of sigma subunit)